MGPKRYTEMPCDISLVPIIDAVVISHNHYDHLSLPTVKRIKELHPNVHFFVPLGNKAWFTDLEIHNVTELDWWDSRDVHLSATESKAKKEVLADSTKEGGGDGKIRTDDPADIRATVGCLPCQHTSARTPFDKAHTLWASWSVESGGQKVWFGG